MGFGERIKKIAGYFVKKGDKKKTEDIPKEIMDKLPPGVKIKRIEIGPKQIVKMGLYLILAFWLLSTVKQLILPQEIVNVSLSEAIAEIKKGQAEEVVVMDNEIMVTVKNDGSAETAEQKKILVASKESSTSMVEILQREGVDLAGVKFSVENRQGWKMIGEVVTLLLTVGLPILFIIWFFGKQSGGGAGGMFGFGKSTAKLFIKGKQNVTFKDVAGVEEAKRDLEEVVDFLKHPEKYRKMG